MLVSSLSLIFSLKYFVICSDMSLTTLLFSSFVELFFNISVLISIPFSRLYAIFVRVYTLSPADIITADDIRSLILYSLPLINPAALASLLFNSISFPAFTFFSLS